VSIKSLLVAFTPSFLKPYWGRLEASPLGYRLARGAFWSLAGGLASRILNDLAAIVVARILAKEGFGEFGIIQSTLAMFAVFAGFGMGLTWTSYVTEFKHRDPEKVVGIITLSDTVECLSRSDWAKPCSSSRPPSVGCRLRHK